MPFNTHYLDELTYLREQGRLFARSNPEMIQFLGEAGTDPDVERLLEGFAFLTARLHQRLDGQLPELCHDLIEALWPQFLRPVPSCVIVQFAASRAGDRERRLVPAGMALDSVPVDGTRCRFHTATPVEIQPLRITDIGFRTDAGGSLRIDLELAEGLSAATAPWSSLRLYLGAAPAAANLMLCLQRWLRTCTISVGERRIDLGAAAVKTVGYQPEEALLGQPNGAYAGLRLLHEHFVFPEKFRFIDVHGLEAARHFGEARRIQLEFKFAQVPPGMPHIGNGSLLLHCAPAINQFQHDADPVTVDGRRSQYRVRPSCQDESHYEVCNVVSLVGLRRGAPKPIQYRALHRGTSVSIEDVPAYLLRRRPALCGAGNDCFVELMPPDGQLSDGEVLSMALECSNRRLPLALAPGDLSQATQALPPGVSFRNLSRPTAPYSPELTGALEWRLIAHLALNLRPVASVDGLRALIDLLDVRSAVDQQAWQARVRLLEAILAVEARADTRIIGGVPMRGVAVDLTVAENGFESLGDLHLLGEVLDFVLADYAPLNNFSQLNVIGAGNGDRHARPPRLGLRQLL